MAAARRRNLLRGRRRTDDEGEEEDEIHDIGEDSASDTSVLSDADDHLDAEESDVSDNEDGEASNQENGETQTSNIVDYSQNTTSKHGESGRSKDRSQAERATSSAFPATADTLLMLNGFKPEAVEESNEQSGVDEGVNQVQQTSSEFESQETLNDAKPPRRESMFQRRVREREEYNLKRDSNPAFVPTRGGFFMHDHRSAAFDPSRVSSLGRGKGRAKDLGANPRLPFRTNPISVEASSGRWNHDLHDAIVNPVPIAEENPSEVQLSTTLTPQTNGPKLGQLSALSKSVSLGTVMVRCSLPLIDRPAKLLKTTIRQHTRLPDLRPPLRRDKPVRVSLPEHGARYVFPTIDRSFIFIPRAQRPNQQAVRGKFRTLFSPSQSRHTSAHGGSAYEPSVAMSRRSSVAPDGSAAQDGTLLLQVPLEVAADSAKPVVKLPINAQPYSVSPLPTASPAWAAPEAHGNTQLIDGMIMQQATQDSFAAQLPMHQPRPQKAVSLATIELPEHVQLHAPQQQEQQPFHHQVPAHMGGQMVVERTDSLSGSQFSVPNQSTGGNQASNIPEAAINAEPFQPSNAAQQAVYTAQYPASQPMYYYPAQHDGQHDHYSPENMSSQVYVQQASYLIPMYMPPTVPSDEVTGLSQAGTFAQERNGMVYYYDSTQMVGTSDGNANMGYTVPGAGGMLTPGPEGYYYGQAPMTVVYYPTQQ